MAIMEISVVPLGLGTPVWAITLSTLVIVSPTRSTSPMNSRTWAPSSTAHAADLLKVAQVLHELPFDQGVQRVVTHITIDDRRDKEVSFRRQVQSVKVRLT